MIKNIMYRLPLVPLAVKRRVANFYWTKICRLNNGKDSSVGADCIFMYPKNLYFGDLVKIEDAVRLTTEIADANLSFGDNVQLSRGVCIDYSGGVIVGDDTLFSKGAIVLTHSHGRRPRSAPEERSLSIGCKVWIGQGALILDSVNSLGDNSIIGAGSVVTKDVGAGEVWAGVPATRIGTA